MNKYLLNYYNTEHWKNKRKEVLSKWVLCQRCCSKEKLNVHHGSYKNLYKEEWNEDLYLLCEKCHKEYHERTFKINIRSTRDFILGKYFPQKKLGEDYFALEVRQK